VVGLKTGLPAYRELFSQAWPEDFRKEGAAIRLDQVYTAIAAFELSLLSLNSRYDQYAHGYAEMPPQSHLDNETRLAAARFMLQLSN